MKISGFLAFLIFIAMPRNLVMSRNSPVVLNLAAYKLELLPALVFYCSLTFIKSEKKTLKLSVFGNIFILLVNKFVCYLR